MPFRIREATGEKRVYAGDVAGWVQDAPPPPEDLGQKAKAFDTKEEAEEFARKYGMKADVEEFTPPKKETAPKAPRKSKG